MLQDSNLVEREESAEAKERPRKNLDPPGSERPSQRSNVNNQPLLSSGTYSMGRRMEALPEAVLSDTARGTRTGSGAAPEVRRTDMAAVICLWTVLTPSTGSRWKTV